MRALRLEILADAGAVAAGAARVLAGIVRARPGAVIGLATGGTMEPVYAALLRAHHDGLSFAGVTVVGLDEYAGLGPDDPNSYHAYLRRHFLDHVDIPEARRVMPRGGPDPVAAARDFAARIAATGPADLQLLGVGRNGHIGFNEPGTPIDAPTRVVRLAPSTVAANARFFGQGQVVPDHAVTMGCRDILSARRLLVLATGADKAAALGAMLDGPVGPDCPASYVRTHPDCRVLTDGAAAAGLLRP